MGLEAYAVILIGGKGKRLRPLSTDSKPKAFLSISKDRKTMFRKTVERAGKILPFNNILVVGNKAHSRLAKKDFPEIRKENLLLEPISRNTAPAITLAAMSLEERTKDAVMVMLPTDQYIADEWQYLASIKNGIDFAKNHDKVVVMAVKPRHPATEFGYLRVKPACRQAGDQACLPAGRGPMGKCIFKVEEFVEKPDLKTAKKYLKSGDYLWNTGAFIFKVLNEE